MLKSSYRIATVWGIPIDLNISLILMAIIFVQNYGLSLGLLLQAGLLFSIALHELGHSFVAIHKGCRVRGITLMIIGGVAKMDRMPTRPRDEVLMALAGPAVSLVLGVLFGVGGWYSRALLPSSVLSHALLVVGGINIALTLFNLIPSFPMDGGRVLRALLTPKMGRLKATGIAARIGRGFAVAFGIYGVYINHWTLLFIAIFLYIVAGREYRMLRMEQAMRNMGAGGGFNMADLFGNGPSQQQTYAPDEDGDDRVTISPPPYAKGKGSTTEIHPEKKSPFGNIFGR